MSKGDVFTICFKNGKTLEISKRVMNVIKERTISGAKKFQCFSNENDECFLIINLEEIICII